MKLNDRKTVEYIVAERFCEECGEPATKKVCWLLENFRSNPNSSAYRRDDCSWCADGEPAFSCDVHEQGIRWKPPEGYVSGTTFHRVPNFEHMFVYWKKVSETLHEAAALGNSGKSK